MSILRKNFLKYLKKRKQESFYLEKKDLNLNIMILSLLFLSVFMIVSALNSGYSLFFGFLLIPVFLACYDRFILLFSFIKNIKHGKYLSK